jgi:hypothetical protein
MMNKLKAIFWALAGVVTISGILVAASIFGVVVFIITFAALIFLIALEHYQVKQFRKEK